MAGINRHKIEDCITNGYLQFLLRVSIGALFIASSISKLQEHTKFVEIVKDLDLLPESLSAIYGNTLPWVELIAGVYLVFGILRRPTALVLLLMALSFLVANISSLIDDSDYCGSCFGDFISLTVKQALAIDIITIIASLLLLYPARIRKFLTLENLFAGKISLPQS